MPLNTFWIELFRDDWASSFLYAVKKVLRHSLPKPGSHLPNSPWAGIIKFLNALFK
jgi:hypothetical protein